MALALDVTDLTQDPYASVWEAILDSMQHALPAAAAFAAAEAPRLGARLQEAGQQVYRGYAWAQEHEADLVLFEKSIRDIPTALQQFDTEQLKAEVARREAGQQENEPGGTQKIFRFFALVYDAFARLFERLRAGESTSAIAGDIIDGVIDLLQRFMVTREGFTFVALVSNPRLRNLVHQTTKGAAHLVLWCLRQQQWIEMTNSQARTEARTEELHERLENIEHRIGDITEILTSARRLPLADRESRSEHSWQLLEEQPHSQGSFNATHESKPRATHNTLDGSLALLCISLRLHSALLL